MKNKLTKAHSAESSITIRLTPYQIGKLLAKINLDDLPKLTQGIDDVLMYGTKEKIRESIQIFRKLGDQR